MSTKTELKKRWNDPSFVRGALADADAFFRQELSTPLDLRGAEIGLDGPFGSFAFQSGDFQHVNLSNARGAMIIASSSVSQLIADNFTFDRASFIMKSNVTKSSFKGFRGRFDATDVTFADVDFSESQFAGGFNEYGFKRCRFERCSFRSIRWRNTFLRACSFIACDFTGAQIAGSVLAGAKISGAVSACELNSCEGTFTEVGSSSHETPSN